MIFCKYVAVYMCSKEWDHSVSIYNRPLHLTLRAESTLHSTYIVHPIRRRLEASTGFVCADTPSEGSKVLLAYGFALDQPFRGDGEAGTTFGSSLVLSPLTSAEDVERAFEAA